MGWATKYVFKYIPKNEWFGIKDDQNHADRWVPLGPLWDRFLVVPQSDWFQLSPHLEHLFCVLRSNFFPSSATKTSLPRSTGWAARYGIRSNEMGMVWKFWNNWLSFHLASVIFEASNFIGDGIWIPFPASPFRQKIGAIYHRFTQLCQLRACFVHRNQLSKRLLYETSASEDAEKSGGGPGDPRDGNSLLFPDVHTYICRCIYIFNIIYKYIYLYLIHIYIYIFIFNIIYMYIQCIHIV